MDAIERATRGVESRGRREGWASRDEDADADDFGRAIGGDA